MVTQISAALSAHVAWEGLYLTLTYQNTLRTKLVNGYYTFIRNMADSM